MGENDREAKRYSLKEREYRGEDGKIHHHTHVWMEQHAGESAGSASRGGSTERSASSGRSTSGTKGGARASSASRTASGSLGGSSSRSDVSARDGSGREAKSGHEEDAGREGGGVGRALAAAGVVAMATAAFMVGRRLRHELDSGDRTPRHRPGERADPRVVRADGDQTGGGMY